MRKKITRVFALFLTVCMTVTVYPVMAGKNNMKEYNVDTTETNDYAEGEAIIMYNSEGISAKSRTGNIIGSDIEIVSTYVFGENQSGIRANKVAPEKEFSVSLVKSDKYSTKELIDRLSKKSNVKYAEPNYKIKKADYNDSYYRHQWAQENKGQNDGIDGLDINADVSFLADKDSQERVIALVDTGIDYTHEDLKDVVWNNPYNNRKLLGQHGYDFINKDADPLDDNGHGSHCSGIMAAKSNNETGIAGTAKSDNVKIMALKILDESGSGYGMEAVGAYNYIYKAQQLGVNVVAVNNSWGSGGDDEESEILKTLINLVGAKGAISVCAAGNESEDNDIVASIPANIDSPYVVSVAASNEKDELAAFSNYGKKSVDIAAPGADILSTVSYNCFNPGLYENKFDLCSTYESFDNGNMIRTMDENGSTENVAQQGDIAYGTSATDEGEMNVFTTTKQYFGEKSSTDKSLQWTIQGAKAKGYYYLYLPYDIKASSTQTHASLMAKVTGPSAKHEDASGIEDLFEVPPVLYFADYKIDKDGKCKIGDIEEEMLAGSYIDEGNYWTHFSNEVSSNNKKEEKHALVLAIYAAVEGDYTVYVDDMGISRENVSADNFGKYDYYNGTSMAAPHVTGAVAAVANAYPDETALQIKARILGSVRKSESLKEKMVTGGVLDLSKVEVPDMTIEKVTFNNKKQLEIHGYYTENALVYINDKQVKVLSNNGKLIVVDGQSYSNRQMNIKVVKNEQVYEDRYFFTAGKSFKKEALISGGLNGGQLLSSGESMVYINANGQVIYGLPYVDDDTNKESIYWSESQFEFKGEMFGKEYAQAVDYTIYNDTDYTYTNGVIYGILTIDVGYASDKILACYNEEKGWKKLSDIPEDMYDLTGSILAAYNGDLYLAGGIDETGTFVSKVKKYSVSTKKWTNGVTLPECRAFSKALQVGKKLVITLGSNGTKDIPKNIIFDGKKWTTSKVKLGKSIDAYNDSVADKEFLVTTAQVGLVKDGIVYTDMRVENLGDTFRYDVNKDTYTATGYALNSNQLEYSNLFATTVQDKLYVIYGEQYSEDDFDEFWSTKDVNLDQFLEEEEGINCLSIPITNGFINVIDNSGIGGYVGGAGFYLPGDTITLKAMVLDEDMIIKKFVVNGKDIKKGKTGYVYTVKASDCPSKIKAEVVADYSDVNTKVTTPGRVKISKATRAKNNKSIKLVLKKVKKAKGYQVMYSTSKKFGKKVTKTVSGKKLKITLKKLKAKKKYYVKARAYTTFYGEKIYGAWSKVKVVKVKKKK